MTASVVLALSTSLGVAHVLALRIQGQWLGQWAHVHGLGAALCFEFRIEDYRQQSLELLPRLQQAMVQANLTPADIAVIGVDTGPGGFTSLRTACGVAQGLSVAWAKPVVPVCSLHAMAVQALVTGQHAAQGECVSAIDARLNEVYVARIDWERETPFLSPELMAIDQWPAYATTRAQVVCDLALLELLAREAQSTTAQPQSLVQAHRPALGVAYLAFQGLSTGQVHGPEACQPMYVRDKVAQTTQERMAERHGHL